MQKQNKKMRDYRYILPNDSKKHNCPACNKKRFVKYIDKKTRDYLPDQYGRCDRESKCTYHLNPYSNGYAKMIKEQEKGEYSGIWKPDQGIITPKPNQNPKPEFIPDYVLKHTLQGYEQNRFIQNLLNEVLFPFEAKEVENIISLYYLGTICKGYRKGAITFPFVDSSGNIRAIQVKHFDKNNHTTGTDFLHSIIEKHHSRKNRTLPDWLKSYIMNEKKVSCLFGEHLLGKYELNPVALVEAPKTAIYGTLYFGFPEKQNNFLWLAVYNLSSLNFDKCKSLKGRDVYLFPDLSKDGKAFNLWNNKAKELENRLPGTKFIVSDLLEQLAPEMDKDKGKDLADYLIKQDWRNFRKQSTPEQYETIPVEPIPIIEEVKDEIFEHFVREQPENWEQEINMLEVFFASVNLPAHPIKLNQSSTINNIPKFIENHIVTVKFHNGLNTFLPYLDRLKQLKDLIMLQEKSI